jgi:hypothetical protein
MQFHAKGALLLLLFCQAGIPAVLAQQKADSNGAYLVTREPVTREDPDLHDAAGLRPLTLDEGLAILGAALDSRHHPVSTADCSHLVHALYERAGFYYAYASSTDLYAGIDEFHRVTNSQPGDLAVWRGHVGIVVNPVQHSFFSLLRSGPAVESYDSPYWKRRGRPRFLRYVVASENGALAGSLRTANMTLNNNGEAEESSEGPLSDATEETSRKAFSNANRATKSAMNATNPPVPVVHSVQPKPDQIDAAFLQSCADSEENLRGRDLFKSAQPVIVFEHFAVGKVHITGNQGWAEVQIDEVLFFVDGKAEARKGSERQRWPLTRRDQRSWELTPSRGTIYIPQPTAVRILSHQLAQLTEDSTNRAAKPQQKAELARVLDSLLQ